MHPYIYIMRLDKPIGIWLLLIPALWSITLATDKLINAIPYILLFSIGAITMRSAGCIINDLWDRNIDKLVKRTKSRPLANGEISPPKAIALLATLLLFSFFILLQFNKTTIILGFITIPLIVTYPLMKRITWYPQAFLGLTFNFGALMGWSAVTGEISTPSILLYIGGIFWTLGYDTIYAHQDKNDDIMAGIKSTAIKFGKHSKIWVGIFYALSLLFIFSAKLIVNGITPLLITIILPALYFAWQIKTWDPENETSSLQKFKSNKIAGLLFII